MFCAGPGTGGKMPLIAVFPRIPALPSLKSADPEALIAKVTNFTHAARAGEQVLVALIHTGDALFGLNIAAACHSELPI